MGDFLRVSPGFSKCFLCLVELIDVMIEAFFGNGKSAHMIPRNLYDMTSRIWMMITTKWEGANG